MTIPGIITSDATGPLLSVIQGALRLNPCLDLDVDVVAVAAAAGASAAGDWAAIGTVPTGLTVNQNTGVLSLTPNVSYSTLFSQTVDDSVYQQFNDNGSSPGPAVMWLDFFPDPAIVGDSPITIAQIDLALGKAFGTTYFTGTYQIQVTQFDDRWRRIPMCDPLQIPAKIVTSYIYTVDFVQSGLNLVFYPGRLTALSGQGLDASGNARNLNVEVIAGDPVSQIPTIRGFSIGISTLGANAWTAPFLGCAKTTSAAQFDDTKFWRVDTSQNRNCGPYDPYVVGAPPTDLGNFPGDGMGDTGAVVVLGQSYGGALSVTAGYWGRAKQILQGPQGAPLEGGRTQNPGQGWHQPYHNLRVPTYTSYATYVGVVNLGIVPTEQIEIQLDDGQPTGTSITYSLAGSTTGLTGSWVSLGSVVDGQQFTGSQLYQYYQLTALFQASPNYYATPYLQAWTMVARTVYNTFTYISDQIDCTVTVDPIDGTSEVAELKLPLNRIGPKTFADPATEINTQYAPNSIEAYVYAKNRVSGQRYFLNCYRLENREPSEGLESMTFVSGLDQLSCAIPSLVETFTYPASGNGAITVVTSLGSNEYRCQVTGSPWTSYNPNLLVGFVFQGITGATADQFFAIVANTGNTFTITCIDANGNPQPGPSVGDLFQLHSQIFNRPDVTYAGVDYAAIYADIVQNQAQVPARYRGLLPATTGRQGTGVLTNDNTSAGDGGSVSTNYTSALQFLEAVAVHCQGFVAWRRGKIDFVPFYTPRTVTQAWDDRHLVAITPALGADRRMPSIYVKYNYDPVQQQFANGATYNDLNAVIGWGRSNLFDIYQVSDDICKWNGTPDEALFLANMYLGAWSTGARYWKVQTAMQYPWLQEGDCIAITTDDYTDRRLSFSGNGLVDLGTPVKGRLQAIGIIIGKNLWGDSFVVAIRGLSDIQPVAGTNSEGGAFGTITCPTITVTVEPENATGWQGEVGAVSWVNPESPYFAYLQLTVQASGNTAANVNAGTTSPYRLSLAPNTTYTITPAAVSLAGTVTPGTPVAFTTPPSNLFGSTFQVGNGGQVHHLVGSFQVSSGSPTPSTLTSSTGTNPNSISEGVGGGLTTGLWYSSTNGAVITLTSNPIATTGQYTLTLTLVGANTPASVRAMIEYSINGGAWQLYGYTPAQTSPYTGTGITALVTLSTGTLAGATSVAFRVTAQVKGGVSFTSGTVTSTVTFSQVAWSYAGMTTIARAGTQLSPAASQPHLSMVPQASPPTAATAVAGELTIASLNSGTLTVPQMHDGNAIATYQRYETQLLTADAAITAGTLTVIPGTDIEVGTGEEWIVDVEGAVIMASGPPGSEVTVQLMADTAVFNVTDCYSYVVTSGGAAPTLTTGTPAAISSTGTQYIRQRWHITITTGGTMAIGAAVAVTTATAKRGMAIMARRVA